MSQVQTEKTTKRRSTTIKKPSTKKNGKEDPILQAPVKFEPENTIFTSIYAETSAITNDNTQLKELTKIDVVTPGYQSINKEVNSDFSQMTETDVEIVNFTENLEERGAGDIGKKRGRKPRGGKLIIRPTEPAEQMRSVSNVILHLKCSMKELYEHNAQLNRIVTDPLKYNPDVPPEVVTYNTSEFTTFQYGNNENTTSSTAQNVCESNSMFQTGATSHYQCATCRGSSISPEFDLSSKFDGNSQPDTTNIKDINAKLKILKVQLYKNAIQLDKKSACFWCTYDFDNIPCHIPKYELDDTIYGYGSFCRPECAVAYLMKENIDDSTKFERYQLLNQIYSKTYGCKKNIKPAPNPYYLLEKYYGNLTIQEYRKLLKTEHLLLVIDKPLTRILPELHEDNEDMIMNVYGINKSTESISGVYKVKRQSEKQQGPSKASIIRSKFGLN